MKEYEKPQMEVIELSGTDIITTSCTPIYEAEGQDDESG